MKKLSNWVLYGMYLNIIWAIYDKATAKTILSKEKLKAFSLRTETRLECLLSSLLFSVVLEVLARAIGQGKINKSYPNGKEVKLSLFTYGIYYI